MCDNLLNYRCPGKRVQQVDDYLDDVDDRMHTMHATDTTDIAQIDNCCLIPHSLSHLCPICVIQAIN